MMPVVPGSSRAVTLLTALYHSAFALHERAGAWRNAPSPDGVRAGATWVPDAAAFAGAHRDGTLAGIAADAARAERELQIEHPALSRSAHNLLAEPARDLGRTAPTSRDAVARLEMELWHVSEAALALSQAAAANLTDESLPSAGWASCRDAGHPHSWA